MQLFEYLCKRAIPEPMSGCWLWLGAVSKGGYPAGNAHRRAFNLSGRVIPPGLELDHLCRVRCCINPEHLEPVTHKENMRRGKNAQKTHCIRGHLLSDTAYITKTGHRYCRSCVNLANKQNRAVRSKRKAAWRGKNKEKDNATWRKWYAANRKHRLSKVRENYRLRASKRILQP